MNNSLANIDALLEPLLSVSDDEQADAFLSQLITESLDPVIKGVIRYKLHFNPYHARERADTDDIAQEATVQLLAQLRKFRQEPRLHPIGDVRGLTAVITHRACAHWMRRQFPEHHAFKNRLHYLITRQNGFALWQNENRKLVAGFAAWQGRKPEARMDQLKSLSEDEPLLAQIMLLQTVKGRANTSAVVAAIFDLLGGPVEFDELVNTLAALLGIRDRAVESTDWNEDPRALSISARDPDPAWRAEKRIFLQRLWDEVRELPPNQRAALLLNLKDADGRGCIALFPAAGIASVRQLAEALEISVEDFSGWWNELPFDDAKIASLFQTTRQQVINARKSARERLARRLKGFI